MKNVNQKKIKKLLQNSEQNINVTKMRQCWEKLFPKEKK